MSKTIDKEILDSVELFFDNFTGDAPESQIKRMNLLKWSNGGHLLLSGDENEKILARLDSIQRKEKGDSKKYNVPDNIQEMLRKQIQEIKKKQEISKGSSSSNISNEIYGENRKRQFNTGSDKIISSEMKITVEDENRELPDENIETLWKEKQKKYKVNADKTPLSMFIDEANSFKIKKKYSTFFEKLPVVINSDLGKIDEADDEAEQTEIYNKIVNDLTEAHKLEHRFPLIECHNKMKFRWMEYVDSIGHFQNKNDIKKHIEKIENKFKELTGVLGDIYKEDPKINAELINLKNTPLDRSDKVLNSKKRELDLLISAKEKAAVIADTAKNIEKIDSTQCCSSKMQDLQVNTFQTCSWLNEMHTNAVSSGKLENAEYKKALKNEIEKSPQYRELKKQIQELTSNTPNNTSAVSENINSIASKYSSPPASITEIDKLVNNLNTKIGSILSGLPPCKAFRADGLKNEVSSIQSDANKLNSEISGISQKAQAGIDENLNKATQAASLLQGKMNGQLAGISAGLQKLTAQAKFANSMNEINALNGEISSLNSQINSIANMPGSLVNELNQSVSGFTNGVVGSFCSVLPHYLLVFPIYQTRYNNLLLLLLSKIMNFLRMLNSEYMFLKNYLNSYVRGIINSINAMINNFINNIKYGILSIISRIKSLIAMMNTLIAQYLSCCNVISSFLDIRNTLLNSLSVLQRFMVPPNLNMHFNGLNNLKNSLKSLLNPNIPKINKISLDLAKINFQKPALKINIAKPQFNSLSKSSLMGCLATAEACMKSVIVAPTPPIMQSLGIASSAGQLKCKDAVIKTFPYQTPPTGEVYGPGMTMGSMLGPTLWPSSGGCKRKTNVLSWTTEWVKPYPCVANLHTPFFPGSKQVLVMEAKCNALIVDDKCMCLTAPGGEIVADDPGQYDTKLESPS